MNILFLAAFGITLLQPPSMIYRFAIIMDKSIPASPGGKKIAAYCKKVTIVWIVFFVFNGIMAAWTIFYGSDVIWAVYNGGVSYIMIALLFAGEFLIRKKVQKKMPKAVPLSAFNFSSRDPSMVMCYESAWNDTRCMTWKDFLEGTAKLRQHIEIVNAEKWLLHCEDCWYFLLAFTALLQCKKEIVLSANISPAYIAEIRKTAPFLTDQISLEKTEDTYHIPVLLRENTVSGTFNKTPAISRDETSIVFFTSGSTGNPKAVKQRLTEIENDNNFILSKWGEEFFSRKVCSTVSQHHIYGLLFSILLPFTAGIPFRRERIQIPEELEKLTDTEYMIITVPAFLKRVVEIENSAALCLKSPWIFVSGGVLGHETAKKTNEVFGFWPVEIYGSTETSGIAWRQADKSSEWTAFDNTQLTQNEDGCLIVRSSYIKDPEGFETADLAELLGNGRFLLKGRIDSVVKIEEKRISLLEMESRILQSALVSDVCVTALEGKRQYLAAAVVFNDKGKEQFRGLEKNEINKFFRNYLLQYFENQVIPKKWRYLEELPSDAQGKRKKEDIKMLFDREKQLVINSGGESHPLGLTAGTGFESLNEVKVTEKNEKFVVFEFSVPGTSPYFDGHFANFPILPAVAQIEIIVRLASRYLGIGIDVSEIKRIKFSNLALPNRPYILRLEKVNKSLSYKLYSGGSLDEIVYSSGTMIMREIV
ncbi:MAG: AMP-binding protein [Spirochaetes bacterium]|nr:AMP-binding protein [Spirochaetota bacterium]